MKLFVQLVLILVLGAAVSYFGLNWLGSGGDVSTQGEILNEDEQALRLAEARGCLACHSLDGSAGIGPSWLGGWGTLRTFTDGSSALVDAEYLQESMNSPPIKVVEGFENIMLPAAFTQEETALVVNLIKSLNMPQGD